MSCWRVLELFQQPDNERVPPLLVKPVFGRDSYTVHLTCLSSIWSEELDLSGIVDRAASEQSPIEVSKQDTAQLPILLDNVKRSLEYSDDAICRITRTDRDGITLHTTITLPQPLDSLTWKFYLERRASTVLKNELILPLLLSSHIQHERIASLVSAINEKDKAISRLVDQYESSNLDLAAAFPVIGGLKTGRKVIKREQAARHIPALQPFREDVFKQETGQLKDGDVSTLSLFQEALAERTPNVPPRLKSGDADVTWWTGIPTRVSRIQTPVRRVAKDPPSAAKAMKLVADSSGEETEDEFETHSNFNTRNLVSKNTNTTAPPPPARAVSTASEDDVTEDDDDLDAPPKSRKSSQPARKQQSSHTTSSPPEPPLSANSNSPPMGKLRSKAFRIGRKNKELAKDPTPIPQEDTDATTDAPEIPIKEPLSSQMTAEIHATPNKARRNFKIGGKGKNGMGGSSQIQESAPPIANRTRATRSPSIQPPSSPPAAPAQKEKTPMVEAEREETAEEKAERRRAELKRKTEEAAKKQAQGKKKRRF